MVNGMLQPAHRAYDLEGKTVGTVGVGRIGKLLLQRLKPFNCKLLYHDRVKIDAELETQIGPKYEEHLDTMLPKCDIIVVNTPLIEKAKGLFNKERLAIAFSCFIALSFSKWVHRGVSDMSSC